MLVISRKPNQAIRIGDNIEVRLVKVKGQKARIGVIAPRDVPVQIVPKTPKSKDATP